MAQRLANELTKYIVADKDFQRQIENDKVFTCEKHFHERDIETCKFENFTIHRVYFFVNLRRRRRRARPRAIPLAMIHMRKSIHGFPSVSLYGYGAPLGGLRPRELRY